MYLDPTVFVLDDDVSFLRAIDRLLRSEQFVTQTFASARQFLEEHDPAMPGCLLMDVSLPDMSGLGVQRELLERGCLRPVVFITGKCDMTTAVEGMRAGAVSFLAKPVSRGPLLECLREALAKDATIRKARSESRHVVRLLETLTPREREVLELVARGLLNKQMAAQLGIAEKTIKVHRGRVMVKMKVKSAAAVVHMLKHSVNPGLLIA
jgi:FixJ family two-component response regulator